MYVCTSVRPVPPEDLCFRKKALRDAVICIGWLKLLSVLFYIGLYLLIYAFSEGTCPSFIQCLLIIVVPLQVINGLALFLGALEFKVFALEVAIWMCIGVAAYNTILGVIGSIYYIRNGLMAIHFMMAFVFALLILSIFTVLCHDVIVIYTFRSLVLCPPPLPPPPEAVIPIPMNISGVQPMSDKMCWL